MRASMSDKRMQRLAVYCGAAMGSDPAHAELAARIGRRIAERGLALVYGGGHRGLMGVVADAALGAGGEVFGVIPQALVDAEAAHRGLTELTVVANMHERKAMMTELTDAFVAIPGGIGTLDELFEAWSWHTLGYHAKPFALLHEDGFWDHLLGFLDHAAGAGFISAERRRQLLVAGSPDEAIDLLRAAVAQAGDAALTF
jgi:uncharacterized protein (TIGR00730 family)